MARPRANIDTAALADAFAADGLHGTSSVALAAATGIAKPTLYVHGISKEALFLRAVEAEVERVLTRLYTTEAATAGQPARWRAIAAAQALLDHAAARPRGARPRSTPRSPASPTTSSPACAATSAPRVSIRRTRRSSRGHCTARPLR